MTQSDAWRYSEGVDKTSIVALLSAFFVFLSFNPFVLWGFSFSDSLKTFFDAFFVIFFFSVFFFVKVNKNFFIVLPLLIVWGWLRFIFLGDDLGLVSFFGWFIKCCFILLLPTHIIYKSGFYFGLLLSFFGLFSILGFLFIFLNGYVPGEFSLINPYEIKALLDQNYIGFYFGSYLDYLKTCNSGLCIVRMNGALDEPGLWGTVCSLYLASDRLNLKPMRNKVILISGILTFSLAFYLIIIISSVVINYRKSMRLFVLLGLSSVILIIINREYFFALLFDRISVDSLIFQRGAGPLIAPIIDSDLHEFVFGHGYLSSMKITSGASSWIVHWYEGGLALILATFFFYAFIFIFYKNMSSSIYFFPVILVSFIQRPEIVWIGYLYLSLLSLRPDQFKSREGLDNR